MQFRTVMYLGATLWAGCSSTGDEPRSLNNSDSEAPLQVASAAVDPGPRGGALSAGLPFDGLSAAEKTFFNEAREVFAEVDSVSGAIEEGKGLGPTFNGNSCAQCHAEPTVGGTSPHPTQGFIKASNPQVGLARLDRVPGQEQVVPSFITPDGPIREARFISNPDGSDDGGVHGLYTIAGRTDAPGCSYPQPDFAKELVNDNVSFRIPTPVFGLGLLEAVDEATLEANLRASTAAASAAGCTSVRGAFNRSGNDGTITRFGWKAQNKSLLIFAGEAYNVEQGVSNELFPEERNTHPGCQFNASPEDATDILTGAAPDTASFAAFMRLSAPPAATTASAAELRGKALFGTKSNPGIGCVFCHTDTLTTGSSRFGGMSNVQIHPYSDLALHAMGAGLADSVSQGGAAGDQFRTAPLWGVGQRIFFLHDGRATPANGGLVTAITAHAGTGSEANRVIRNFLSLPASDQQAVVDFLRSL